MGVNNIVFSSRSLLLDMFRAHSPYSPFFTSGLLSEPLSARTGSPPREDYSAIYLDVVFHDDDHYRSFLSLDLAETQSMRSLSLKRKPSSKFTARSSTATRPVFGRISEVPSLSSLRSVPSPKPVPSTTLPLPPVFPLVSTTPPRLPSLPPLPSLDFDLPTSSKPKSPPHRKSSGSCHKPPPLRLPSRQPSVVSTRTRLRNRAAALALLEGRQKPSAPRPPIGPLQECKNFMSMSDDEEEVAYMVPKSNPEDDVYQVFNPSFEPEDIVLPPSPTTLSFQPHRMPRLSDGGSLPKTGGRKPSQRRAKHKTGKASEWFPLKSFIDLYNENDDDSGSSSWNWRSFIEVSNVS